MGDVLVAVSERVGGLNIKSASGMNKAVVFLAEVQMVDGSIEGGIKMNDTFVPILPLSSPSKKTVLSNLPPLIQIKLFKAFLKDTVI